MKSDFFLTENKSDLADWRDSKDVLCQLGYMADRFHEMIDFDLQLQGFNKKILEVLAQYNIHWRLLVMSSSKFIVN